MDLGARARLRDVERPRHGWRGEWISRGIVLVLLAAAIAVTAFDGYMMVRLISA